VEDHKALSSDPSPAKKHFKVWVYISIFCYNIYIYIHIYILIYIKKMNIYFRRSVGR
jgi:hypothetical protein